MSTPNWRNAVDDGQCSTFSSGSRRYSDSENSDTSYRSISTVPTDYGFEYIGRYGNDNDERLAEEDERECYRQCAYSSSRVSVNTYASTVPSIHDSDDEGNEEGDVFDCHLPKSQEPETYAADAIPSTPADFADLFPSTRRLTISHDDSTSDGNMNLRVNTHVKISNAGIVNMTLFHLRMYGLKTREFSLRRYDRDSGREVCHTVRKFHKPAAQRRPGLQRSLSNALASLRSRPDNRMATVSSLRRSDSGYESIHSADGAISQSPSHAPLPTNTTKLEFSNYAQVEVKRRGTTSSKKHYDFEWWGSTYHWRRIIQKDASGTQVSYHLFRANTDSPIAHIVPEPLSAYQKDQERAKGGWVPSCSMWISDERLCQMQNDISDVIIASGLVALVDDCIKRRFHNKQSRHRLSLSFSKTSPEVEFVSPKRLMNEILNRPSTSHSSSSSSRRPSLFRQMSDRRW